MSYSKWVEGGFAIVLGVMTLTASAPLLAASGDVLLIRQVQPRVATRPPAIPDPNPRVVNPKPSTHVGDDLQMRSAPNELNDGDFAAITTGARMTQQALSPTAQNVHTNVSGAVNHSSVAGNNPVGHVGGTLGKVDGQINRSIQQGLRPLQILQGP